MGRTGRTGGPEEVEQTGWAGSQAPQGWVKEVGAHLSVWVETKVTSNGVQPLSNDHKQLS